MHGLQRQGQAYPCIREDAAWSRAFRAASLPEGRSHGTLSNGSSLSKVLRQAYHRAPAWPGHSMRETGEACSSRQGGPRSYGRAPESQMQPAVARQAGWTGQMGAVLGRCTCQEPPGVGPEGPEAREARTTTNLQLLRLGEVSSPRSWRGSPPLLSHGLCIYVMSGDEGPQRETGLRMEG